MDPSILFEIFSMTEDARDTRHFPPSQLPQRKFRQIRQILVIRNRGMRSHLWNPTIKEVNKHRDQTNTVLSSIENCTPGRSLQSELTICPHIGPHVDSDRNSDVWESIFFFSVIARHSLLSILWGNGLYI